MYGPVGIPALPWLSYFQELNVRTYVYDKSGTAGVWFYSLDCNQPAAVLAARSLFGLPYFHAKMSATKGDWIDYASRRTGTKECAHYRYRGTGDVRQVEVEMLEFFLLERYCLYSRHSALDHLLRVRVSHRPYQFRSAEVSQLSNLPARLDGFSVSQQPDHVCMVDALDVKVYYPEKVT